MFGYRIFIARQHAQRDIHHRRYKIPKEAGALKYPGPAARRLPVYPKRYEIGPFTIDHISIHPSIYLFMKNNIVETSKMTVEQDTYNAR